MPPKTARPVAPKMGNIKKILLLAISTIVLYIFFLLLMTLEIPQRHVLYMNGVKFPWFQNLWKPETLGFSAERVHPFFLETPDNEQIFAWHILPPDKESAGGDNGHLEVLKQDETARVIIYFHGTASHIAQWMRLDAYRIISAANRNTHILAIDYRGWGYSSGVPSEDGVITDGLTALNWAINTAGVDPSRVLLVGQSLGTAIATGVVTKYYEEQEGKPLAGLVLVAAFTSLRNVVGAYRMGGVLPLLGPLNVFPKAVEYLIHNFLRAEFNTAERIGRLARGTAGTSFSLTMVHALNDWEIPYQHSRDLFISAGAGDINIKETNSSSKVTREIEGGRIRHIETVWGGHNAIQKSEAVLKAILSAWRN